MHPSAPYASTAASTAPSAHAGAAYFRALETVVTKAPVGFCFLDRVDDNRDAADSMHMLLGIDGNDVAVAYDGATALQRAEEFRPDVILLDLGMPGMDGYETCRRLRQAPWARAVKIIALTGWGQDSDRDRTRAAGFDQHLVKPLKPADLYAALAAG